MAGMHTTEGVWRHAIALMRYMVCGILALPIHSVMAQSLQESGSGATPAPVVYQPSNAMEAPSAPIQRILINGARNTEISAGAGVRQAAYLDLQEAPASTISLDSELAAHGLAVANASNSLGMATSLSVRGFSLLSQGVSSLQVGHNFINGYPDLVWRFIRDPVTVSAVSVVTGADASLLGANNPAGTLHFQTKSPEGDPHAIVGAAVGSSGLKRSTADLEWQFAPLQTRLVAAVQGDDRSAEGVKDGRAVVLLSNKLPWSSGNLKFDLEYDRYSMPFAFGTMYAGDRFWFDTPYVDSRSFAKRQYFRQVLEFSQQLLPEVRLTGALQNARSTRHEMLLGAWAVVGPSTASGYYRTIDEKNRQQNASLRLDGSWDHGWLRHQWEAVAQWLHLQRNFSGPQNIAGYSLDLANPVFPADLSVLPLVPRYAFENYGERGIALADSVSSPALPGWKLYGAMRRSWYQLNSSSVLGQPPQPVAHAAHNTAAWGIAKSIDDSHRVWLSKAEAFLPNRGQFANGTFLPPSQSRQWELGWAWRKPADASVASIPAEVSVALFDLRQTNLSAPDPVQPDAYILLGKNRSYGTEVRASARGMGLDWQANLTVMRPRIVQANGTLQSRWLTGAPDFYGALKAGKTWSDAHFGGLKAWLQVQASSSKPGDSRASFRAPGYGVVNLGLERRPLTGNVRWGVTIENVADRRYVRALSGPDTVWQGPRRRTQLWVEYSL